MPYSEHIKPVKVAVDVSQLEGYEEFLDALVEASSLTKADLKEFQSEFFRNLWAKGQWSEDGKYVPNWWLYLVCGHPTDNTFKRLKADSLWFVDFVEQKLKAGQIVPVLELARNFKQLLEQNYEPA